MKVFGATEPHLRCVEILGITENATCGGCKHWDRSVYARGDSRSCDAINNRGESDPPYVDFFDGGSGPPHASLHTPEWFACKLWEPHDQT